MNEYLKLFALLIVCNIIGNYATSWITWWLIIIWGAM